MLHILGVDWKRCSTDQVDCVSTISNIGLYCGYGIDVDSHSVWVSTAVVSERNESCHFESKDVT